MATPIEDRFPPDHIVDLEEAAMGWVLRLTTNTITINGHWRYARIERF